MAAEVAVEETIDRAKQLMCRVSNLMKKVRKRKIKWENWWQAIYYFPKIQGACPRNSRSTSRRCRITS